MPEAAQPEILPASTPRRWLDALLVVGLAWRVGRWALGIPLWRDEANLGLNILGRSFADLAKPLDYFQVAPLLFLWIEKAVILTLGAGDWAVRLVPTLASVTALLLFARLAVRAVAPLAAACAVGFLAAAYYTTRYGSELKPYSVDLLASVLILHLTLEWLDRPRALLTPALLIAATPVLVGASYPAVFVAAAAGLVLAAHAVRERDRRFLLLAALQLVVTAGAFLVFFFLATSGQERVTGPDMRIFWAPAFPPANPARFLLWLLDIHTGNLAAYPVGGKYGGSTLTFLLMLAGIFALRRSRRHRLLWLLLLPFGLNLLAAALHRYPYGDYARVAQHLAPAICLLAGCGAAALLERIPERLAWRRHAPSATLGLLALIGLTGLAIDASHPYKLSDDVDVRRVVKAAFARQPDRRVLVFGDATDVRFLWYLKAGPGVALFDPPESAPAGDSLSALAFSKEDERVHRLSARLETSGFVRREDVEHRLHVDARDNAPIHCRSLWWTKAR